jgi:hypothetical protein
MYIVMGRQRVMRSLGVRFAMVGLCNGEIRMAHKTPHQKYSLKKKTHKTSVRTTLSTPPQGPVHRHR